MSTARKDLLEFIEKYKECECLWKLNDEFYKNKQKRTDAMLQLLQILKKTDPDANLDSVARKINSIRCSFNKEYNKVLASRRLRESGKDVHIEHVPKLWYYNFLSFVAEQDAKGKSTCQYDAVFIKNTTSDSEDFDHNIEIEQPSAQNLNLKIKREMETESTEALGYSSATEGVPEYQQANVSNSSIPFKTGKDSAKLRHLNKSSLLIKKPKFSAFGEHIAEKLRSMDSSAAKFCQKIINDAIYYAEFNNLNATSRIVTDHQQQHSSFIEIERINILSPSGSVKQESPYQSPH